RHPGKRAVEGAGVGGVNHWRADVGGKALSDRSRQCGVSVLKALKDRARHPLRDAPPVRTADDQVDLAAQAPSGLGAHVLPADRRAYGQLTGLDDAVVIATDVESVLPHRWQILVVSAEDVTLRTGEQESVSHMSVIV